MKNIFIWSLLLLTAGIFGGCKKDGNYPGARVSPYISLYDLRNSFKGNDITLNEENMFGATKISALVVSDHSGGNLPEGMLVVQDARRLGQLRGISIPLGAEAANYAVGDSLIINVGGKMLKRVDGILQITGVTTSDITKVASGIAIAPSIVTANKIIDNPSNYESTLVTITSAGFDPTIPPGSTYEGDRIINDGFANIVLHTEPTASFASDPLPYLANFTGIVVPGNDGTPQLRPRVESDITILSATAPKISAILITGYLTDPTGSDANYEYIQLLATKDIDFSVTPFSIVTTNNAGTALPQGVPPNGWATGGGRTYKIDITSGSVLKGQYFYVGANAKIWGSASADVTTALWVTKMYATVDGDGFGTKTSNLLANSGNAGGIAVFEGTTVEESTIPDDVIFYGGGGSLFNAGPPARGYRITNTDYYDMVNPVTLEDQPFFAQGSNTGKFSFPTTSNFTRLNGTYNKTTGRWTQARLQTNIPLTTTSTVAEIEGGTTIEE